MANKKPTTIVKNPLKIPKKRIYGKLFIQSWLTYVHILEVSGLSANLNCWLNITAARSEEYISQKNPDFSRITLNFEVIFVNIMNYAFVRIPLICTNMHTVDKQNLNSFQY